MLIREDVYRQMRELVALESSERELDVYQEPQQAHLDRLPLHDKPAIRSVGRGEVAQVKRNQIIVWVSIGETFRPFPAILDTGFSHNFGIARRHLDRWSGHRLLRQSGEANVGGEIVPRSRRCSGFIATNPGSMAEWRDLSVGDGRGDLRRGRRFASGRPAPSHWLTHLIRNDLTLVIDGKGRRVTLKTAGWF